MKRRLVLVGAGHAHLGAFSHLPGLLRRGHEVTVISQSRTYCYSGMAPGVLGGHYATEEIGLDVGAVVEAYGARFIEAAVTHVNAVSRRLTLDDGSEEPYDVVSLNVGSYVPTRTLSLESGRVVVAKPILNFLTLRDRVRSLMASGRPVRVLVVGGGPAGLEISANLRELARREGGLLTITVLTSGGFMAMLPSRGRRIVDRALEEAQVEVIEGRRLTAVEDGCAVAGEDLRLQADLVSLAVGVRPVPLFRESGLPVGDDGGLLVNRRLQSVAHPEIFAAGDCATMEEGPLPRIGVVACRQNPVITHNVRAALEGRPLREFHPHGTYLQIFNLGRGRGLLWYGRFVLDGRIAFRIKDWIDRRFMRRLRRALTTDRPRRDASCPKPDDHA